MAADNTYIKQQSQLLLCTLQNLPSQIRISGDFFRTESERRYDRPSS